MGFDIYRNMYSGVQQQKIVCLFNNWKSPRKSGLFCYNYGKMYCLEGKSGPQKEEKWMGKNGNMYCKKKNASVNYSVFYSHFLVSEEKRVGGIP